jgi:DNA-directed RNA polymerase subunit RPC12/RpoP
VTVKVISGPKVREVDCHRCGCKLEYTYNDIRDGVDSDYTGGRDNYNYIECPNCAGTIKVKK